MKKVGKEFRKSLSAILAAAMVVSSMPETSLVANAEEADAQQQSYELDESSIVDNGESITSTSVDLPQSNVSTGAKLTIAGQTATVDADTHTITVTLGTVTEKGNDVKSCYDFAIKSVKINGRTYTDGIDGLTFTNDVVNYNTPEVTAYIELQATLKDGYTYVAKLPTVESYMNGVIDDSCAITRVKYLLEEAVSEEADAYSELTAPLYIEPGNSLYVTFDLAKHYSLTSVTGQEPTDLVNEKPDDINVYKVDTSAESNIIRADAATVNFGSFEGVVISKKDDQDKETFTDTNLEQDSDDKKYYVKELGSPVKFMLEKTGVKVTSVEGEYSGILTASNGKYTITAANAMKGETITVNTKEQKSVTLTNSASGTVTAKVATGTSKPSAAITDTTVWKNFSDSIYVNEGENLYIVATKAKATVEDTQNTLTYTVGSDSVLVDPTSSANNVDTWEITIPADKIKSSSTVDISTNVAAMVSLKASKYAETGGYSIQYAYDKDATSWTNLTTAGDKVYNDRDIYVKVTSKNNKLISDVTYHSGEEADKPAEGSVALALVDVLDGIVDNGAAGETTKVYEGIYKLAGGISAGYITATVSASEVSSVTVNTENVKKVEYSLDNGTSWLEANSSTIKFDKPADLATAEKKVKVRVTVDTDKYMYSSVEVNDKKVDASGSNNYAATYTFDVPLNELNSTTNKYTAIANPTATFKAEALAYDYTIEVPSTSVDTKNYTLKILNGITKYKFPGDEEWTDASGELEIGSGIRESGNVTVRIPKGTEVKFCVAANKSDYEVSTLSVSGNTNVIDNYVLTDDYSGYDRYYKFKSAKSNDNNYAIEATMGTKQPKKVTIDWSEQAQIKEIYAYVNASGKAVTEKDSATKVTSGQAFDVFPGTDVLVEIETNDYYVVDKVTWTEGNVKHVETGSSFTLSNVTDAMDLEITTKQDTAKLNSVEFTYADKEATVTSGATRVPTDETKSVTGFTIIPDNTNTLTFTVKAEKGYEVTSVTIDGTEQLSGTDSKIASGNSKDFTVEYGTVKDSKDNTIPAYGVTKSVVITTAPVANESPRIFTFTRLTDSDDSDDDIKNYTVSVPDQSGVTKFTRSGKDYWNIEPKTSDEVIFSVTGPITKKLTAKAYNVASPATEIANAVIETAKVNADKTVTYTFKINASALTAIPKGTQNSISLADNIVIKPETDWLTVKAKGDSIPYVLYSSNADYSEADGSISESSTNNFVNGKKIVLLYKSHETLSLVTKDEAENEIDTAVTPNFTVEDKGEFEGWNATIVKVSEEATYRVSNENLGDYRVTARVASSSTDATDGYAKDDVTGLLSGIDAKGNSIVYIKATDKAGTTEKEIKVPTIDDKAYKTTVAKSGNELKVVVSPSDAGKTITIPVVVKEGSKYVTIEEFALRVAPAKTTAEIKGIKDGETYEIEAGSYAQYDVTYADTTAMSLVSSSNATFYDEAKNGKSVLFVDASDMKVDSTKKVSVNYDGSAVVSFTVKAVAPKTAVTTASASQGCESINVTFDPKADSRIGDGSVADLYYEIKVTPAAGTAPKGSATKYYYIPVDYKWVKVEDSWYKEYKASSKSITVNTADKNTLETAWSYTIDTRIVLAKENIETTLANSVTSASSKILAASEVSSITASTKNRYYEDNLSAKQLTKTVYTGQKVDLATINYSSSASYVDNVDYELVNSDGIIEDSANASVRSGVLTINVPDDIKPGKYKVNIYAQSEDSKTLNNKADDQKMVQAKTTLSVTVKAGTNWAENLSDISIAQSGKKNVSYTFKPIGYSDYYEYVDGVRKYTKSANQKFVYSIDKIYSSANADNVTLKNNKLTISKNFVFNSNENYNKIDIRVKGADETVDFETVVTVTVTQEIANIGSIVLMDSKGKDLGTSLTYDQTQNGVTVVVKDVNGENITNNVTLTPASGSAYISGNTLYTKYGKAPKSVTIKATTKDGGKKSKTLKVALGYNTSATLTAKVENGVETSANNWKIAAKGGLLYLDVFAGDKAADRDIYNWSASVKGGKIVRNDKTINYVSINPTSDNVVITLTDNSKKPKVKTVINVNVTDYAKDKAPKFTLNKGEKIYAGVNNNQTLEYTVKSDEYKFAKVTRVSTSDKVYANAADTYAIKDGVLTVVSRNTSDKSGTDKYQIVFGDKNASGIFVPATKPATLNIKINKKSQPVVETNYSIAYKYQNGFALKDTKGIYDLNVIEVQNNNVNGQSNNFASYFVVNKATNTVDFRGDLVDNKVITKTSDIANIKPEDLVGYVKYSYKTAKGTVEATAKVTVKLVEDSLSYSFKTAPVVSNSTVYVTGYVYDEAGKFANIKAGVTNVKAEAPWTVTEAVMVNDKSTGYKDAVKVTVRATGVAVGSNAITLNVVPNNTLYSGITADTLATSGIKVTGSVDVLDAATLTGKIALAKDAKIDLTETTSQTYNSTKKVGSFTVVTPLSDIIDGVDAQGIIEKYSNAEKIVSAVVGDNKTIVASVADGALTVTIPQTSLDGLKAVDVTFGFNHAQVKETLSIPVVQPDVLDINAVAAKIQETLVGKPYVVGTTVVNNLALDVVNKYKAAGTEIKTNFEAKVDEKDANAYHVTGEIRYISDTNTVVKVECTMYTTTLEVIKKGTLDDVSSYIYNDAVEYIVEEKDYDKLDEKVKANYLEATAATTANQIQNFLQAKVNAKFGNGSEFTVSVPEKMPGWKPYVVEAPAAYQNGSISYYVYLEYNGRNNYCTYDSVTLTYTKYAEEKAADEAKSN